MYVLYIGYIYMHVFFFIFFIFFILHVPTNKHVAYILYSTRMHACMHGCICMYVCTYVENGYIYYSRVYIREYITLYTLYSLLIIKVITWSRRPSVIYTGTLTVPALTTYVGR